MRMIAYNLIHIPTFLILQFATSVYLRLAACIAHRDFLPPAKQLKPPFLLFSHITDSKVFSGAEAGNPNTTFSIFSSNHTTMTRKNTNT
jgi:hypothetical protein